MKDRKTMVSAYLLASDVDLLYSLQGKMVDGRRLNSKNEIFQLAIHEFLVRQGLKQEPERGPFRKIIIIDKT